MRGDMRHSLDDISDAEADEIFAEMQKTALHGVFEWITLVFQVDGVSRAFTHQAVRHRVGFSYSQESMRFTKVEDMTHSVVTEIRTLDRNYDGLTDQLVFADLGGRVWRVDINNSVDTENFGT